MHIKGLIFNFDGLILDTEVPEYQAWKEIYHNYHVDLPLSKWVDCIGASYDAFDPIQYLESLLGTPLESKSMVLTLQRKIADDLIARQPVLPGVKAYLRDTAKSGLKVGLASSSSHLWANSHLIRLGLYPYFDVTCCKDDVEKVKPEPDLYRAALQKMGLEPGEAIAFEDSLNGIKAAKLAGLTCVAVPNPMTQGLDLGQADYLFHSLEEVPLSNLLHRVEQNSSQPAVDEGKVLCPSEP